MAAELRMEFYHRIRGGAEVPLPPGTFSQEIRRNAEETRAYFLAGSPGRAGAR